jgi:hypothetical protein
MLMVIMLFKSLRKKVSEKVKSTGIRLFFFCVQQNLLFYNIAGNLSHKKIILILNYRDLKLPFLLL